MSGIFGIWNLDGEPVQIDLLAKLCAIQAHRGPDGTGRWIHGSAGFVFQNQWVTPESVGEIQPFVCQDSVALFDGRLDNREELLDLLKGSPVSSDSSDAALVSAAYEKLGEDLPNKLTGDFALALYDRPRRKLLLARDGIGVRPLYYAQIGRSLIIASECKPILAHPGMSPRPNADMLAAYFLACFGREREGWTFFEGISSVLPGQLVVIRPDSTGKRTYWDFDIPEPIRFKTLEQYAEVFRHHFERAVARRLRSAYPVVVSLSGGLDSSSVFCTAETLRRSWPHLPEVLGMHVHHEGKLADESLFVDEIERQYGVEIQRLPDQEMSFITGPVLRGFRDMEAPFLRGRMDFEYSLQRAAQRRGARVILTGLWGDQMLSNRAYWVDLIRQGRWLTAFRHVTEFPRWYTTESPSWYFQCLLSQIVRAPVPLALMPGLRELRRRMRGDRHWFAPEFWQRARRAERLQEFKAPGGSVYQKSVYEMVRPMYYGLAMDWVNKIDSKTNTEQANPFFDRDLISYLMAIPGEIPCCNGVPKALLRCAMRDVLPPVIAARRWKGDGTREFNESVSGDFGRFAEFLRADAMSVQLGYIDGGRLQSALQELRDRIPQNGCLNTWQLVDLFGLELWLQSFFGTRLDSLEENKEHVTANA